jgi:hypothetical protein
MVATELTQIIGDEVAGFLERRLATSTLDVRVFTPVYAKARNSKVLN